MRDLLKGLNKKFEGKDFSAEAYQLLFRRFAQSIPEPWVYLLYTKACENAWRQNGDFNKEEFLEVAKCKGSSELQTCLCKDAAQPIDEERNEEEEVTERKRKRKELCKRCFWFQVLLKLLEAGSAPEVGSGFHTLLASLPQNCDAWAD